MTNPIKSLFVKSSNAKSVETRKSDIVYRVVFVSPFFELEVKTGSGVWQTVHSQKGEDSGSIVMYPMLRFSSYDAAILYAKETLCLTVMKNFSFFGIYTVPPASFERGDQAKRVQNANSAHSSGKDTVTMGVEDFSLTSQARRAQ